MAGAFVVLAPGAVQLVGGMREWTDSKVAGAAPDFGPCCSRPKPSDPAASMGTCACRCRTCR